jgi:hypothetical protein
LYNILRVFRLLLRRYLREELCQRVDEPTRRITY